MLPTALNKHHGLQYGLNQFSHADCNYSNLSPYTHISQRIELHRKYAGNIYVWSSFIAADQNMRMQFISTSVLHRAINQCWYQHTPSKFALVWWWWWWWQYQGRQHVWSFFSLETCQLAYQGKLVHTLRSFTVQERSISTPIVFPVRVFTLRGISTGFLDFAVNKNIIT